MAAINVGQLVATTLRKRLPKLYDNVSHNVAYYNFLQKRGNMKFDGGREILAPLEYATGSLQWYSGYDKLNSSPTDFIDGATYDWKFASLPIPMSGEEQVKNSGDAAVIKLATSKVKNAEKGFTNGLGAAVYGDGTSDSGKSIGGQALLVSTSPSSGSVGAISCSNAFWQNQYFDASTYIGATITKDNIRAAMSHLAILCARNNEKPDAYFTDNNIYELYWNSLQAIQRITNENDSANTGWSSLEFGGKPVVLDGGQGGSCPSNTMYANNMDYMIYFVHEKRQAEVVGGERTSINQDASVQFMLFAGNMATTNRALQGVMVL